MNLKTPVEELMENFAASAPPALLYARVVEASASVASTSVTAVVFSGTLMLAVSPPPLLVICGVEFVRFTVKTTSRWSLASPSVTRTRNDHDPAALGPALIRNVPVAEDGPLGGVPSVAD